MTIWVPDLTDHSGPKYKAIADAISADVASGRLAAGERLPTHRDLAFALGVTVGTITRAYKEAERRGLLAGEVGRGTFVREASEEDQFFIRPGGEDESLIDLGPNYPPVFGADLMREALRRIADMAEIEAFMRYTPEAGLPRHRALAAEWLAAMGVARDPGRIVVTCGAQNALDVVLSTVCPPGDTLLVEELTYPTILAFCARLGLKVHPLAMDGEGLLPEALDEALAAGIGRIVHLMSTLHNPTNATMSQGRRERIAEVVLRHGALVSEDDVYGWQLEQRAPALSALLPDNAFYVNSASKCLLPGLRVGFINAPPQYVGALAHGVRIMQWMAPPMMVEVVAGWIEDGTVDQFVAFHRAEAAARWAEVQPIFGNHQVQMVPGSNHVWVPLPEHWRCDEFVQAARGRGVQVVSATLFAPSRRTRANAFRVCLGIPRSREILRRGVEIVVGLMNETQTHHAAII